MIGGSVARQVVREAIDGTSLSKGRSVLALIGVAIGTAAVITMLHVGHNARKAALSQFDALGTDLVVMRPRSSGLTAPQLDVANVLELVHRDLGISEVSAMVQSGGSLRLGRANLQVVAIAATDRIYSVGKARLALGRWTSDWDGTAPFTVIGYEVAAGLREASGRDISIGDQISFGDQIFIVIGILAKTPENIILNIDFNRSVVIPFAAARRITARPDITDVIGRLKPGANDSQAADAVKRYFAGKVVGGSMEVTTARDLISNIEAQMRIYSVLLLGIGAISLIVGGVGIMNVMLMSAMERRQEIGLRIALGARRRDIRSMFLTETLILAGIGSAIGTVTGYIAGRLFANFSGWEFEAAPLAIPLGAGMALVVGLFFGIYPATKAAALDPVAALRSE